ncbi:MAG: hypothetical protein LBS59_09525 [Puniceicoccales bacterium]|nr:hypothetical protein [Puniceicoccales bacterium]
MSYKFGISCRLSFWYEEKRKENIVVLHEDGMVSHLDGGGRNGRWKFLEKGHFKIEKDGFFQGYWNDHTWRLSSDGRRLQRYQGPIKFDGALIRFNP